MRRGQRYPDAVIKPDDLYKSHPKWKPAIQSFEVCAGKAGPQCATSQFWAEVSLQRQDVSVVKFMRQVFCIPDVTAVKAESFQLGRFPGLWCLVKYKLFLLGLVTVQFRDD